MERKDRQKGEAYGTDSQTNNDRQIKRQTEEMATLTERTYRRAKQKGQTDLKDKTRLTVLVRQ